MARQKKPVHRVQMTEGKRNIIRQLLEEYDIENAEDLQDALKDLLGGTIKEMMEAEMDNHLGYEKSERSDNNDYRNGYKRKQVNSRYGSMEIEVPQDRKSTFEPQVVKKRQKDISDIDQKIVTMYAKGMTTRQISEIMEDIYGFEASEGFISDVTDKILPQIEDWQNRPLDEVYPVVYIDAIHYSVRDNGVIRKLAAYVILGINTEGKKEVLSITIGENESAKFWLSVLNELKNRGVKDILIICADGLSGIKEAIAAAFPKTEYQRCIVHQVRNTLKYVPDKDRKAFAADLKTIYQASDERNNDSYSVAAGFENCPPDHPLRKAAAQLAQTYAEKYGCRLLTVKEIFDGHGDFNLVMMQKKLVPNYETFDDSFVFTGVQIGKRTAFGSWKAPDNGKPLLYSSLGTAFNNWPEYYPILFDAVRDLDINVFAAPGFHRPRQPEGHPRQRGSRPDGSPTGHPVPGIGVHHPRRHGGHRRGHLLRRAHDRHPPDGGAGHHRPADRKAGAGLRLPGQERHHQRGTESSYLQAADRTFL